MKKVHTHYDNLKVARNAPFEVIRAAYKSLSQLHHPDRNKDNPEANRIMRIINASYEVLSDPIRRKEHDEWIKKQESLEYHQYEEEQDEGDKKDQSTPIDFDLPSSGSCLFYELPKSIKEVLIQRAMGLRQDQYKIALHNIIKNYIYTFVLLIVLIFIGIDAADYVWNAGEILRSGVLILASGVFLTINSSKIIKWHIYKIGKCLILTPLYLIKTDFDKVYYWPLFTISDVKATNNYINGGYQNTLMYLKIGDKKYEFTIKPENVYTEFLAALQRCEDWLRTAANSRDVHYIIRFDEFSELRKSKSSSELTSNLSNYKRLLAPYGAALSGALVFFLVLILINKERPTKPQNIEKPSSASQTAAPYTRQQPNETAPLITRPAYIRPSVDPNGLLWPTVAAYLKGFKKLHTNGLSTVTVDNGCEFVVM